MARSITFASKTNSLTPLGLELGLVCWLLVWFGLVWFGLVWFGLVFGLGIVFVCLVLFFKTWFLYVALTVLELIL